MKPTDPVLRRKLAARLREERRRHFATAAEAARVMRLKEARYVHYENGRRWIDRELAPLFAKTFRVPNPAYFLVLSASKEGEGDPQLMADIPVVAEAAVGVWREEGVDNMSHQEAKKLMVPHEVEWSVTNEYAVQVRDTGVNKLIPKDGWAIFKPLRAGPVDTEQFDIGAFVHIERVRRGGLKEISVRRVSSRNGAQLRLSNFSTEKKYRGGDLSYPSKDARDGITIKGILVGFHVRMPIPRS